MNQLNLTPRQLLLLSDICLIVVAILWGSSYGVAKQSLLFYPVLGALAVRFGLTSLLLLPSLWQTYKRSQHKSKETVAVAVPLGVLMWVVYICETFGVLYTSVTNAVFLVSLCLIITPFFEWFLLKNRPHKLVFVCAVMSLIGTYLLTLQADGTGFRLNMGDGLILLAAVYHAVWAVLTKKRLAKVRTAVSSLNLTAVQSILVFVGSALVFVGSQVHNGEGLYLPVAGEFWLLTLYLVVFCTIFAFFVQNSAIRVGSPSRASLLMGSEPVFGAVFAVMLFGESVSVWGWVGGALITLSSLALVRRV